MATAEAVPRWSATWSRRIRGLQGQVCFSDGVTVFFDVSTGNRILQNSIFSNAGLGIDLDDGLSPNDPGHADLGPNNLQNKPAVASATTSGSTLTVQGNLDSTPEKTFTFQFFSNARATRARRSSARGASPPMRMAGPSSTRASPPRCPRDTTSRRRPRAAATPRSSRPRTRWWRGSARGVLPGEAREDRGGSRDLEEFGLPAVRERFQGPARADGSRDGQGLLHRSLENAGREVRRGARRAAGKGDLRGRHRGLGPTRDPLQLRRRLRLQRRVEDGLD